MPPFTVLAILAIGIAMLVVASRIDGLALFAPKSTKRVAGSAHRFCTDQCKTVEGECPLAETLERPEDCPLWKFIEADVPTDVQGSPFAGLKSG